MKYSLVSGKLPNGITISQNKGAALLQGVTLPDVEFFSPPIFIAEPMLGYIDENEEGEFNMPLEVPEGRTLVGVTLVDGYLPWGLEFDNVSIRGRAMELLDRSAAFYAPEESPVWITPEGSLAEIGENETASIDLEYEDGTCASVHRGSLPWGLEVVGNSIVGTASELVAAADQYLNTLGPIWQTQAGMIGIYDESAPVELSVSAIPRQEGDRVNIYLVNGFLPYGLELTPSDGSMIGVISGVVDELRGLVDHYGPFNSPRLDTTELPPMALGSPVTAQMAATSYGRKQHGFVAQNLPWGVNLAPSGELHGTPIEVGEYDVTITVQDDDYLTASRTFKITITE